jgi:hypothetical protein
MFEPVDVGADAADDSAGAAVPARDYGPGRIRPMAMLECTAASGRHNHATGQMSQSDARDFGPSFYTPIDLQGSGRVAK